MIDTAAWHRLPTLQGEGTTRLAMLSQIRDKIIKLNVPKWTLNKSYNMILVKILNALQLLCLFLFCLQNFSPRKRTRCTEKSYKFRAFLLISKSRCPSSAEYFCRCSVNITQSRCFQHRLLCSPFSSSYFLQPLIFDSIPAVVCSISNILVYMHGIASGTEQVLNKYLLNGGLITVYICSLKTSQFDPQNVCAFKTQILAFP